MIARTKKIFLLWLLVLAIPVQGFAAVAQLGCASPHPMPMTGSIGNSMSMAAAMPPMAMTDMQHTQHMQHASGVMQHGTGDPAQHHSASASCSSCAVCTIGAILPLALDKLMHLPLPDDVHIAMTTHGYVGYTPENPERPPSLQG